jgi:hypothetical protein
MVAADGGENEILAIIAYAIVFTNFTILIY